MHAWNLERVVTGRGVHKETMPVCTFLSSMLFFFDTGCLVCMEAEARRDEGGGVHRSKLSVETYAKFYSFIVCRLPGVHGSRSAM